MSGTGWRRVAGLVVSAAAVALVLATSLPTPATSAPAVSGPATRVHYVSPTSASGALKPRYHVAAVHRGYCWTISDLNPGLYRCFWHNQIEDPCWAETGHDSVVCLLRPWSHRVMRLMLTRRLPKTMADRSGLWGLTTRSSANCEFVGGARSWFHGRPVSYLCPRRWVLVGAPQRRRPTWWIRTARRVHHHYLGRGHARLSDAWRAKAPER